MSSGRITPKIQLEQGLLLNSVELMFLYDYGEIIEAIAHSRVFPINGIKPPGLFSDEISSA
jgi:hypothetical protein